MKIFENSSNIARIDAKLCQNAFRTISDVSFFDAGKDFPVKFSDRKFHFSLILRGFGGATAERTPKSAALSNFALDSLILKSVRPKNRGFDRKSQTSEKISPDYEGLLPWGNYFHSLICCIAWFLIF